MEQLLSTLNDFGVTGQIVDSVVGPVVTLYRFIPARGIKIATIVNLSEDIARTMKAKSVRVYHIDGTEFIGIEISNNTSEIISFNEIFESAIRNGEIPLVLGKNIDGSTAVIDLAKMPHILMAGTTGSGKSVVIHNIIMSLIKNFSPEQCKLMLVDPKMLELTAYNGSEHLIKPVITNPTDAINSLEWLISEMTKRYNMMMNARVRNIKSYNETAKEPLPYIVTIIDEMADLMMVAGKEIESLIQRLAQMARASGIHLIVATQRPSVDVITGVIKANFPARIALRVASKIDSRIILDTQGAENLLGRGDMIVMTGAGETHRVHGAFISEEEVDDFMSQNRVETHPLVEQAIDIINRDNKKSRAYLTRRLNLTYEEFAVIDRALKIKNIILRD